MFNVKVQFLKTKRKKIAKIFITVYNMKLLEITYTAKDFLNNIDCILVALIML